MVLCQAIDAGHISPAAIEAHLRRHWRSVLRNPELHLLAHRALRAEEPSRSLDALNRYLRTQGSDQIESIRDPRQFLKTLSLRVPKPVLGGPLVSVLVSAYNAAETAEYAVRSMLQQSYQNLEILVCDDASTDATASVLAAAFSSDPRVSLFRSRKNQGTYNIRNSLMARARGELVTVHDADDLSLPRRIEYQVRQLRDPRLCASVTNLLRVSPEGTVAMFHDGKASRMSIVSLMASPRIFNAVGGYRSAAFGADFEVLERLKAKFGAHAIGRIRSPQMLCLWAEQSATRQSNAQSLASGYRSPARRLYCDLVYRQRLLGRDALNDDAIDDKLRESNNWRAPSPIDAL